MIHWWLLPIAYMGGAVVTAAALLWAMTRTRTEAHVTLISEAVGVMDILKAAGEVDAAIGHRLLTLTLDELEALDRRVAEAVLGEEAG